MHLVVLPGDGIGPEITRAALEVLRVVDRRLSLGLEFETHEVGMTSPQSGRHDAPQGGD